jgi:hypothetical protein
MNPWDEDFEPVAIEQEHGPWETADEPVENKNRGRNWAGYARNAVQAGVPFFGPAADEIEAYARANIPALNPRGLSYEDYHRNAEESRLGNIKNAPGGKATEIGASIAGNALLAALSRGASLTPAFSSVQGGVEGYLQGMDPVERGLGAAIGAGTGWATPKLLNWMLPTKGLQQRAIQEYAKRPLETAAKDSKAGRTIIAKAIQEGKSPLEVVTEVGKGWRPTVWKNLGRSFKNETPIRSRILSEAAETTSKPYEEYVEDAVGQVAPKYAKRFGRAVEKLKLDELGDDVVGEIDSRAIATKAVNDIMRGEKAEVKNAVGQAVSDAVAKRGVAKKLSRLATPEYSNMRATAADVIGKAFTLGKTPSNAAFLRITGAGRPGYVAGTKLGRALNFTTPDSVRGAMDDLAEDWLNDELNILR